MIHVLFPDLIILYPHYNTIEAAAFGNSTWNVCMPASNEIFVPSFWHCTQQIAGFLYVVFVDLFISIQVQCDLRPRRCVQEMRYPFLPEHTYLSVCPDRLAKA